jgi:hypothetical protein
MEMMKNFGIMAFLPLRAAISQAINSPEFIQATAALYDGIAVVTNMGVKGFNALGTAAKWAMDNLKNLSPIILAIVGAIAAHNAVLAISTALSAADSAITVLETGAKGALSLALAAATGNQIAFNAALQACPIVWIIDAVMAAVVAVVALIVTFHELAQTGHTVIGDLVGFIYGSLNVLQEAFLSFLNATISIAEFIANAFIEAAFLAETEWYKFCVDTANFFNTVIDGADKAATALANAFIEAVNEAVGALNTLADGLSMIPGIEIGHIGKVGRVNSVISGRVDTSGFVAPTKGNAISLDEFKYEVSDSVYDAYMKGYEQGAPIGDEIQTNLVDKVTGIWNGLKDVTGLLENYNDFPGADDGSGTGAGSGSGGKKNVGTVDKVKNVKLSDADVKIFRDLATRKYMANVELQTMAPNINVSIAESASGNLSAHDVANEIKMLLIQQSARHTSVKHSN